jgi:hypothetical protein
MDDLLGMHEPGYDQWAGLSCNRGPEGEVAPEMEDSRETVDGSSREAQTSSHHSGTPQDPRSLRHGQVSTIGMNYFIFYDSQLL